MATVFGTKVKRREDPRLITGKGTYSDDVALPGMLYAMILRSPYAHANIRSIDVERARNASGVVAVYTGKDILGKVGAIPTAWLPPNSDIKTTVHPALAHDVVRYVGDGVALVVAESRYAARDALDLIKVEYEPLGVVVDQRAAMQEGAPLVHEDAPNNIAFHWKAGDAPDVLFEEAEVVVRHEFRQQRLIPNPMETRATTASYNAGTGELTLHLTSQNPHIHRFLLSLILGIPEHKLRIVSVDVGGGFGAKIACYPDEALVGFAAMELGRPVKWMEDRREHFLATTHGRDMILDVELAGKRDGTMTAIRVKNIANMGAYLSTAGPGVPTILFGLIVPGAYQFTHAEVDVYGVFTNTTPTDAYRGAGRPEATYVLERMVDLFANELGKDPVEVRRQNLIRADQFPYTTPLGLEYDSGQYHLALERALEMLSYQELRQQQEQWRKEGRLIGIGCTTYVEICGLGPSQVAGAVGFQGGLWESSTVRVHPTGKITAFTGASPHGQGEETTFAQIVSDRLGVPVEDIEIVHGDTARIAMGWGTYGSRTTPVGGNALAVATDRVIEKASKIAAHMLEASEEDVAFSDGKFSIKGSTARSVTFQEVTLQAYLAWNLPKGVEPGLEGHAFYDPVNFVYPFGTHLCVVEIDPDTGEVSLLRYIAVDDCGRVINPLIAEGQVHGGIVQGIGQALYEGAVYDEEGQLLTGTFMDYAMPKARFFPEMETAFTETPAPQNPLGVKGIGETGTIASTPTVVNAVIDALKPFHVRDLNMPLTPERVWRAMNEGRDEA
ncbi:xanthine dehydrogenase family protein molybdopterin-binding subunit [Ferroacidibacillus organovorans]|uniref:Carbon monoxide dehydrogenase n=2 Tax=Ferroacidibacillus organovorans TaxID=1765683 RepID=A0A162T9L3_9BACL|nr:molybdopterin cofactor-binding domain-containing protein [Ferroacidibacillus organovorans]KYP80593.1 carbon monoxide dehydrogenase [Ferroacidibacillus organovorans]OPG15857.1 carbon monoxide dehydrogenase [Ferroacidibacillus organovorans]